MLRLVGGQVESLFDLGLPVDNRSDRRLARYRVGAEGRISHLKRRYGMRRTRLEGQTGARMSVGWSILTHNLDTLAVRTA